MRRRTLFTIRFLVGISGIKRIFGGVGTVSGSLLNDKTPTEKVDDGKGLKINVVGIANLDKALFNREGIDLQNYKKLLEEEGIDSSTENFKNEILLMNIFNSVLVDCTASPEIADIYRDMLANNISVVAANKIAASGDYDNYMNLKELARKRGVKYLFETNVSRSSHYEHH